jgi:hypothetical protein
MREKLRRAPLLIIDEKHDWWGKIARRRIEDKGGHATSAFARQLARGLVGWRDRDGAVT